MSQRSITGCSTCKAKRRKCDETKPSCLRCTRGGAECVYEYIQHTGKGKKRTKPANIAEQFIFVSPASNSGTSASQVALSDPGRVPLLDSPAVRATLSQPTVPQQPVSPQLLTSGQASLLDALFSLAEPSHTSAGPVLSSVRGLTDPDLDLDSSCVTEPNPPGSSALIYNSGAHEFDDSEDIEGIGRIMCGIPLALDRTIESNSLPFVLQWHAQWIPLTYFDPKIVIYQTKETIISQFSESLASRFRLVLFSELMRTMVKHRILDEGGKRILQLLAGEVQRNVANYQMQKWPMDEREREHANRALDHVMDLAAIQITAAPLACTLRLLRTAAPVFLSACPPPHPPHAASIMLGTRINLKNFLVADVISGITTGLPLSCRMVVQECWREAALIYFYMVLHGAHALDPRVEQAQKRFMKLVNGVSPGRNPDTFLMMPMIMAGVSATKPAHQRTIKSRILGLPEFTNSNTGGNDSVRILDDIWARTSAESRPARWEDIREACMRVTGV
ncbi:hypothetical protein BN14_10809 [Rhizoctonia solani AG-1 IB]|uniref:Zn(2)-C6 fungal-type domain-containing protein n=1 Tax=Thanatephorus cucumeris (strain AG1-IB / isolate 7/3/14) TaxID=1108050 RepID=M5CGT3_THACB|nr:hypothetical protein BN14_10809 [Rhizoctonia solani AG-1 IB]